MAKPHGKGECATIVQKRRDPSPSIPRSSGRGVTLLRRTLVQGVLAPFQFVVFLISLVLVVRFLITNSGEELANASVVVKTLTLYTIMITGAVWEKVVFGRYLFAEAFFWEDVFSMLVLALHTAYLAALGFGLLDARSLMFLALAAYAAYIVNAAQFLLKLRAARLQAAPSAVASAGMEASR